MNIFISQPMIDKTQEEILNIREKAIIKIKDYVKRTKQNENEINIINTYSKDYNGNRLQFLGKSISEGLAICDLAVFIYGWEKTDGCRSEHFIASQYGVNILYINE